MKVRIKDSGFTLIELMIALLLLSMVIALCASGFRFGTRVWDSVNVGTEKVDNLQAVQGFLRTSLSNSLAYEQFIEDEIETEIEQLFVGAPDRISYVSYSPKFGSDDYLYRYDLFFDRSSRSLRLSYSPYNKPGIESPENAITTLVEDISEIKFEYFSGYETDEETNSDWAIRWNHEFILPLLVRIKLEVAGEANHWPELVVQLRNGPYVIR